MLPDVYIAFAEAHGRTVYYLGRQLDISEVEAGQLLLWQCRRSLSDSLKVCAELRCAEPDTLRELLAEFRRESRKES